MDESEDALLLPGDWGAVDEERERILAARRLDEQRELAGELIAEFEEWLRLEEHDGDEISAAVRTLSHLLRWKDVVLDSPDPLKWSEGLIRSLVGEVFPQRMPDGLDDPRDAAADLLLFIRFLEETKRWRKSPLRGHQARQLLIVLACSAPEDWETQMAALRSALATGEDSGEAEPFDFDTFVAGKKP